MNSNFPHGVPPNVPIYYVQHYPSPPPQYQSPYPPPQPYFPQQYPLQQPLAPGQYIISQNPNSYVNPNPPIPQTYKESSNNAKAIVADPPKTNLSKKLDKFLDKFQDFRLKIKPYVPLIILILLSINVALIDRMRDSRDVCGYSSYTPDIQISKTDSNATSNNFTRILKDVTANVSNVILTNITNQNLSNTTTTNNTNTTANRSDINTTFPSNASINNSKNSNETNPSSNNNTSNKTSPSNITQFLIFK